MTIPILLIVMSSLYTAVTVVIVIINFCKSSHSIHEAFPSTLCRAAIAFLVSSISLYLYYEGIAMTEKELANLVSLQALSYCSGGSTQFTSNEMLHLHQMGAQFATLGY